MEVKKNHVCHISTVHPLFDDRIFYKECVSLATIYEVYLVVGHPSNEVIHGVNIIALPLTRSRWARFFVGSICAFRKALSVKPDVVHIHDPELLWIGVLFRILGKKTVYDVHEDVAKQILYKNWLGVHWIRVIISKIVMGVEKLASLFFNRIVVVTNDIKNNFPASKTVLVRNFPRLDLIKSSVSIELIKDSKVVIYIGSLSKERGILELVNAMEFIPAELWLLGPWDNEGYENECRNAEGWNKTQYFGVKKLEVVYEYLKSADVAVALLYPAKNYVTSLPVKAFEYMALGIPMVISNFPYWKEVFQGCAVFANPHDSIDIANQINLLLTDKEISDSISTQAMAKIQREYSWEIESQHLLEMYEVMLDHKLINS